MVAQKRKASLARRVGPFVRPYKRTKTAVDVRSSRPAGASKLAGANLPFPNTLYKTLRYMEGKVGLNPGVGGTTASYVFTANGLYDPNITGTGHQPMGFDEMMGIYDHYKADFCKVTAMFNSIEASESQVVGIKITDAGAYVTGGQGACEGGNVMFKTLGPIGSSTDAVTIVYDLDIKKFFGGRNFNDRDYQGSASANPLEQVYPTIFCFPNNASDTSGCTVNVILEFATQFTEPKILAQS